MEQTFELGELKSLHKVDILRIPSRPLRWLNLRMARLLDGWGLGNRLHQWIIKKWILPRTMVLQAGAFSRNLFVNGGFDWAAPQIGGTASGSASWIGLTSDSGAPLAGDVTLPGEISINGLTRAQGSFAHTTGQRNYVLTKTFTYTGSASVTVNKSGIFNQASGGTLIFEALLSAPATVNGNGDLINFTGTISF